MTESFDDFAKNYEQKKAIQQRVVAEGATEWNTLKGFLAQLHTEGKTFDGHHFEWHPNLGDPLLTLSDVAASLIATGPRSSPSQNFYVVFSRRPSRGRFPFPMVINL